MNSPGPLPVHLMLPDSGAVSSALAALGSFAVRVKRSFFLTLEKSSWLHAGTKYMNAVFGIPIFSVAVYP